MKTLTTLIAAVFLAAAGGAYAATKFPDKVTLKAEKSKDGPVTFDHKAHMKVKDGCKTCHGPGKPEKVALGEQKAHTLCIECHKAGGKGPGDPKKCGDCHKK